MLLFCYNAQFHLAVIIIKISTHVREHNNKHLCINFHASEHFATTQKYSLSAKNYSIKFPQQRKRCRHERILIDNNLSTFQSAFVHPKWIFIYFTDCSLMIITLAYYHHHHVRELSLSLFSTFSMFSKHFWPLSHQLFAWACVCERLSSIIENHRSR